MGYFGTCKSKSRVSGDSGSGIDDDGVEVRPFQSKKTMLYLIKQLDGLTLFICATTQLSQVLFHWPSCCQVFAMISS